MPNNPNEKSKVWICLAWRKGTNDVVERRVTFDTDVTAKEAEHYFKWHYHKFRNAVALHPYKS